MVTGCCDQAGAIANILGPSKPPKFRVHESQYAGPLLRIKLEFKLLVSQIRRLSLVSYTREFFGYNHLEQEQRGIASAACSFDSVV